ncbi:MAG: fucose isomerase, partial [Pyrobaculum sp.]
NILLAWPHHNSLPSALEAAAALRAEGKAAEVVTLEGPGAEPPLEKVGRLVNMFKLLEKPPRLALVGRPNPWLVASEVVGKPDVEVDEEAAYRLSLSMEAGQEAARWGGGEALGRIVAYGKALFKIATERGADGVTLGCWCFDFKKVGERGWTPCMSLALLNDWGLTATCEGDLRALYSAVVLSKIAQRPAWLGNVNKVEKETLLLTHDGLPPSMASRCVVKPRLATGAPAALMCEVETGRPVTLLRVSGVLCL